MPANQEVSKLDIYTITGLSSVERVTKMDIYVIANNSPPPPPPPARRKAAVDAILYKITAKV